MYIDSALRWVFLSALDTKFIGQLLGIAAEDTRDFDQIIKLKTTYPDQPVYISISWGQKDIFGNFHGRHGLRLKRVVKTGTHPDVHAALSGKNEAIDNAAQQSARIIHQSQELIEQCLKDIEAFTICFEDKYSETEIDEQCAYLLQKSDAICPCHRCLSVEYSRYSPSSRLDRNKYRLA